VVPTERGRRTRKLIIERTAPVFDRQGFAAASLSQLVASTGLTRGAFYFHFDSKDALAAAIVTAQADRWVQLLAEVERQEERPLQQLIALALRAAIVHQTDPVVRAGSRLIVERELINREVPDIAPWWLKTAERLLGEAADRRELQDLSRLVRRSSPTASADGRRALAEYLVAMWGGLAMAVPTGPDDAADRVYTSYAIILPAICSDAEYCASLLALVADLTARLGRPNGAPV
jgi:AcrR family transcriptional regulator